MLALLGLLAVAGYQNRDKIGAALNNLQSGSGGGLGPGGVETRPAAAIPASDLLHVGCCDLRGRLLGFGRRWGGLGVDAGAAHLGGCPMYVAVNSGVNKHGRGQDSPRRLRLMAQQVAAWQPL